MVEINVGYYKNMLFSSMALGREMRKFIKRESSIIYLENGLSFMDLLGNRGYYYSLNT